MAALVRLACPPGGVVLDPCAGTGATLVAARRVGRRSIGVELEERWCRTAASRLAPAPAGRGGRRAWPQRGRAGPAALGVRKSA
ncbi:DNA methyltransferase [Blastococcus sp. BMG 814]|uniref:DNA methyltransferase n=1 Tax=Blastococcus carthaginiensis TaxID=3050034 RepID=A0ABT9I8C6_9ACTN|nr:DNA methyltransferase [Blastococcus carthaginiensis]MDP5181836.1 DNA methyltransferase [Blastococcus carthaginiensis]